MLSEQTKTIVFSLALHGGILGLLATFAVTTLESDDDDDVTEVRIVELEDEAPDEFVEPEPEPDDPPLVPTIDRPQVVPKKAAVKQVEKPKPFQEVALPGDREAPDDAIALPTPTAPVFAMESTVGGDNADYESTTVGSSDTKVGRPGPAQGAPGAVGNQDAVSVKVSKDWEVTSLPDPINDREFEPAYPPLAKREGREARVRLELDIDGHGRVAEVRVLGGPTGHGFRKSAIAYARELRFKPARSGERVVAARIEWTVYFYARN